MRPRNDLSSSFCLPGAANTYNFALTPDKQMRKDVLDAEGKIRQHLSSDLSRRLIPYFPAGTKLSDPKYRKQGSWVYDLLNDPLRNSRHYAEVDSDLGVYMPVTTFKDLTDDPGFAASAYLDAVETSLRSLAERRPTWSVKRKSCCVRVKVRYDAHVDVTCYAMPDDQFKVMKALAMEQRRSIVMDAAAGDLTWEDIPDRTMLATNDGWVPSDAKAIHEFIDNAAEVHGSGFRRNTRFVKGARDFGDDERGPPSIGITLILCRKMDSRALVRDDLGVLAALGFVAEGLMGHVATPGNESLDVLASLSYQDRARLSNAFKDAQNKVRLAIFEQPWEAAHATLRSVFGNRFPTAAEAPAERREGSSSGPAIITPRAAAYAAVAPAGNVRSA